MNKIAKSITINAPVHTIFDYVNQPLNLLGICSNLVAVTEVHHLPNGGASFEWDYKLAGVHLLGVSNTTEFAANQYIFNQIQGGISSIMAWHFQPQHDFTEVALDVEYRIPAPLLRKHNEGSISNEIEAATVAILANLKKHLEHGAKDTAEVETTDAAPHVV